MLRLAVNTVNSAYKVFGKGWACTYSTIYCYLFGVGPSGRAKYLYGIASMELKGRITVYSIIGCPHCMQSKNTLNEHNLPYVDISLDVYPQCREYVSNRTGKKTVPQIFFNDHHVGGNDDLQKLVQDKEAFQKLIDDVKCNAPSADAPQIPDPSTAVQTVGSSGFVCEPDEYARLVQEIKDSGIIKDHRSGLKTYKNSFSGKDFVQWAVKCKDFDEERALEMGQQLIDKHFGHQVKEENTFKNDDTYYRLLEDDDSTALNGGASSECTPRPANDLGEEIRRLILKIYSTFLSSDGKKVNYKGIAASSEYEVYKKLTLELIRVDIGSATREEKLAFFINVYNALVIHANIEIGPPTNLWQRYKFFNTVRYIIGGYAYSLQDIENGVLRGNRKGVGMFSRPFGKNDARLNVALPEAEPLIHFALVCGAKSCPPIKTYSSNGIDSQLQLAAESFLEGSDGADVDMAKKEVRLSMIFKWYREDFGQNNHQVVEWIEQHMSDGQKKENIKELIRGGKYKISHMKYDWGINSK